MTRPPIAARVPTYRELAAVWPVLVDDVMRFAMQSNDAAVRCGRLEVLAFILQLPQEAEERAVDQAERETRRAARAAASNGHAPSGAATMKR